ncbi:MAG: CRISPR-associated helicase Cas3' [Actinobacteria bacterium]|nr:CRISPR-associated helicase Cas3' [Actinomycetota bacterium]
MEGRPEKEWQRLEEHLKNVAKLARQFAEPFGGGDWAELIGWLHDIGKYSEEFQKYLKTSEGMINPDVDKDYEIHGMRGKIDHSTAGAQYVYNCFDISNPNLTYISQIISLCIMSHHSGILDCISPDGIDIFSKRINKSDEKTHYKEVIKNIDKDLRLNVDKLILNSKMDDLLNLKLKEIHDPDEQSNTTTVLKWGLLVRLLFSCLIDADRFDAGNLKPRKDYKSWNELIFRIEKKLSEFKLLNNKKNNNTISCLNFTEKVNSIRNDVSESCLNSAKKPKGLYLLTVPTGGGKTLSSLRFALHHAKNHKMKRIIYILPFTSIIDQNANQLREILEDKVKDNFFLGKVVLEHHSNLTPEKETFQQSILSENWDAPIVFTTIVQFLEAIFNSGTSAARRMHQLVNAVIIFDEVQAIPIHCVHLFNNTINFLVRNCGSTIILCTATQPLLDKVDKTFGALKINFKQKIISKETKLFTDLQRVRMMDQRKNDGWSEEEIINLTIEEIEKSKSVLIIVNTKKAALDLYKLCCQRISNEVYHLSTNVCPAHRIEVLEKIRKCFDIKNHKPVICISTQLIEAGIDIDFGTVIRYLAGLDSIAQAAGRCNRNGLRSKGESRVYIVNPSQENLDMLPDIRIGKEKAQRVLDEFKANPELFDDDILGPKAMELYFKYYFHQRQQEMKYLLKDNSIIGRNDNLISLLSTNQISVEEYKRKYKKAPSISLRQSFMTALKIFQVINTPTQGIIVPFKDGIDIINKLYSLKDIKKQYQLLKKAQLYSVNVFRHEIEKLQENGAIPVKNESDILYLDERYYSDDYGLSLFSVKELRMLNA